MPVPYMGSKRKTASKFYQIIKAYSGDANTIVDLFCGGFAISEIFVSNGWKVISNDLNKYVVALLEQTIVKGLEENIITEFITREKFFDVIKNPNKYDDWYVGYVMCIWSFGNKQTGYLFGKEVEPIKYAGHKLVIDKDPTLIKNHFPKFPQKYIDGIIKQIDWHKRRIALVKVSKAMQNRSFELQQLQQLELLQQLQRLQQLEQKIEFNSKSYDEVEIPEESVIYCDPPYKGTAEYSEGGFNHEKFWEWVRLKAKKHKIFVSEYTAPRDFEPIWEFSQKSSFQGGTQQHNKQPTEKLFILKK